MFPLRRSSGVALLAALVAMGVGSCGQNEPTGIGLDRTILVQRAGPTGVSPHILDPDSAYQWAVNTIDSVTFTDDIDSTTLEVTSFQVTDSLGRLVPGTVRFMPSNAYIHYSQPFPSNAYGFFVKEPPMRSTLAKVYFIPDRPFRGQTTYTYTLTTGIRLVNGQFRRDLQSWSFTTGDSVPPPNPIWP